MALLTMKTGAVISEGMLDNQKERFIQYWVKQLQEADLDRCAIKLVLADFKASQEKTGVAEC